MASKRVSQGDNSSHLFAAIVSLIRKLSKAYYLSGVALFHCATFAADTCKRKHPREGYTAARGETRPRANIPCVKWLALRPMGKQLCAALSLYQSASPRTRASFRHGGTTERRVCRGYIATPIGDQPTTLR